MALTPAELDAAQAQINAARDQTHTNIDLAEGWAEIARRAAEGSGSGSAQVATAEANRAGAQKVLAVEARVGAETAKAGADTARAGSETARTGAETARTGAEAAKAAAETARTQTQTAASNIAVTVANMKSEILGGAGPAFDTLQELAVALGNDPNLASTLSGQIATKQDKPPAGTAASMYLNGSGAWTAPPDTTYTAATQSEVEAGTATAARSVTAAVLKGAVQRWVTGGYGTAVSSIGQSLAKAADMAAARTAIGAGTSNLAIGPSSTTAKAGDWKPALADVAGLQGALDGKVTNKGGATGLWVGTVATRPATGEVGVLYVTAD